MTHSQQHQADGSVVQGNCHYLPRVQFLLYTMLPSLSSVWHLGSWRVTTKVTLDPISAGLSLSNLAVTLPPVEKKIGLCCSKGCTGAEAAISCALFTLECFIDHSVSEAFRAPIKTPTSNNQRDSAYPPTSLTGLPFIFFLEYSILPVGVDIFQRRKFLFLPRGSHWP